MAEFIRIPGNPPPEGAEVFDFMAADGVRLRGATFSVEHPRACVILMAGRCEFIEKYFEVIKYLQARGFSVAMMDWRGQGLSERLLPDGSKGHIDDFRKFVADLRLFTEEVAMKRFGGPYLLMTHSMGGTPSLQLLADGYDKFRAAVLCAPMTRLYAPGAMRIVLNVLPGIASALGASEAAVPSAEDHSMKFEGNVLTSDHARHDRFRELQTLAPNAVIGAPTFGWVKAATAAMNDLHRPERFENLKTPVLIVSAEEDKLVDSSDHETLAARSPLIKRVLIKGALHEIMMEQDKYRAEFWKAVDEFLNPLLVQN